MLVLKRNLNEAIRIGSDIRIVVVEVRGSYSVRLGVEAPKEVSVHRDEVYQSIIAEGKLKSLVRYQWSWCKIDQPGMWALGGTGARPHTAFLIETFNELTGESTFAWRCYLGPVPQIAHPKYRDTSLRDLADSRSDPQE